MGKVFIYELRRQVVSRFFLGLLAVCLFFAWMTLRTSIIQGVANTAPFSPWSFGAYFAQLAPLLVVALLAGLFNVFSPSARRVEVLTAATPVPPRTYTLVKCAAVLCAWLLLVGFAALLGFLFMLRIFGSAVQVHNMLLPCAVVLLPMLLLFGGLGLLAGRLKPWQGAVLLLIAVAIGCAPLGGYSALFGTAFFTEYPLTLEALDPSFHVPGAQLIAKMLLGVLGCALAGVSLRKKQQVRR